MNTISQRLMFGFPKNPYYSSQLTSASIILSHGAYFLGNLKEILASEYLVFSHTQEKSK